MPKFHEFTDYQDRNWTIKQSDDGRIAIECDRVASMESQDHALGSEIMKLATREVGTGMVAYNWIVAPSCPGYYWFWPLNGDPEIRQVVETPQGLVVRMDFSPGWEMGPDPRRLAMEHTGRWCPIQLPSAPIGVVH